jgi:uncharacterized membrane protein YgdD (TMEM256/DUF423 family)
MFGPRFIVFSAGVIGCSGLLLGADASHGNHGALAVEQLRIASLYAILHATALTGIAALHGQMRLSAFSLTLAGLFFIAGIVLFSGSIYLKYTHNILTGLAQWGGFMLLAGWAILAWTGLRGRK